MQLEQDPTALRRLVDRQTGNAQRPGSPPRLLATRCSASPAKTATQQAQEPPTRSKPANSSRRLWHSNIELTFRVLNKALITETTHSAQRKSLKNETWGRWIIRSESASVYYLDFVSRKLSAASESVVYVLNTYLTRNYSTSTP